MASRKLNSVVTRLSSTSAMKPSQQFSKTLPGNTMTNLRFYHGSRQGSATLYSKISPLGNPNVSITPELDQWVEKGNKVRFAELSRILRDLRKRKRFTHALEVSEWMSKKGICVFTPTEHAVQLDLIGRVRGFLCAESYFSNLRDEEKTDKTYGALLNCYVRQRQTDKSLTHLQKMKEMGFTSSPLTYNDMMCLYTNIGQHEKVPDVLNEMKENKVSPDNFSYRICINSYGARGDLEGVEKLLREMENQPHIVMDWNTYTVAANFYIKADQTEKAIDALRKSEARLENKDGIGYNNLITLYAKLGKLDEVLKLWSLKSNACKRHINRDYITMLESLVRLGELEEAEKVLKEWESSGNCYDFRIPNTVIVGYCEKGLFEKAEEMLEDLTEKGKASTPNSWGIVAAGYLDKSEMEKAAECLKAAICLYAENEGWKPNPAVLTGILSWLGDKGSVEDVEAFVYSLRTVIPVNREMYHALIKANIRSGKKVDKILGSMKDDKIDEDEETKKIFSTREKQIPIC